MSRTIGFTTIALITSLAFPSTVKAATLNGGFEDGFNGWETIGDYRIETSAFGSGPVEGMSQAFLSTAYNEVIGLDEDFNTIIGGNAVPVTFISAFPSLEEFLGISTFFGDNSLDSIATAEPIEGSAIKQSFTAQAGQVLSFSWNFLTNESVEQAAVDDFTYPDFNDFAFVSIQSEQPNSSNQLISLADTGSNFSNSSTSFSNETGFRKFSYKVPTTGTYTLGIGVVDVGEPTRTSGVIVDNVDVPEPGSALALLVGGALGTISMRRRGKKKTQR
ncbi:MAG: PEP-CTERM sorting domain-containing protein [Cyanobacteriota bacterium]